MAYFSNASEGSHYAEKWCSSCVHSEGCIVMMLHIEYNYSQLDNGAQGLRDILEALIPMDDDGFPDKCSMYFKSREACLQEDYDRRYGIEFSSFEK